MPVEPWRPWRHIEPTLWRLLGHPDRAIPPGLEDLPDPVITLWHYPARSSWRTWIVFPGGLVGENHPFVCELTWPGSEQESLYDALPILLQGKDPFSSPVTRFADLDPADLERRLAVLQTHRIPLTKSGVGLDGETTGLRWGTPGLSGIQLEWWMRFPEEWRPVVDWTGEFLKSLTEALDRGGLTSSPFEKVWTIRMDPATDDQMAGILKAVRAALHLRLDELDGLRPGLREGKPTLIGTRSEATDLATKLAAAGIHAVVESRKD